MQIGWRGVVFTRLEEASREQSKGDSNAIAGVAGDEASDAKNGGKPGTSLRHNDRKGRDVKAIEGKGASSEVSVYGEGVDAVDQTAETMQYDMVAITYLSLLLLPLVVGFSAKKLVMDEHIGWYSWALQSLTVSGLRLKCASYRSRLPVSV